MSWRLYVDIGNFAVKFGLRENGRWAGQGVRQHFFGEPLAETEGEGHTPEQIVQTVVSAAWEARLAGVPCEGIAVSNTARGAEYFLAELSRELSAPVRRVGQELQPTLQTAYRDPAEIGPDRWANAHGASKLFGAPVVVIDCGTCITSEVVDSAGVFLGGHIAAGLPLLSLGLMNVSPQLRTALEAPLTEEPRHLIGHSTAEAANYGLVLQLAGTADRFVEEALETLELDRVQVVVTGGDGEICSQFMFEDSTHEPLLTLEGLRVMDGYA